MDFALLSDEASRSVRFLYVRTRARENDAKGAEISRAPYLPVAARAAARYTLTRRILGSSRMPASLISLIDAGQFLIDPMLVQLLQHSPVPSP